MGTKSLTQPEVDKLGAVGLAKALASASEYDADTHKRLTSKAKSLDLAKADGEEYDDGSLAKADPTDEADAMAKADEPGEVVTDPVVADEPAPSTMSPGADFLSALHTSINDLCGKLESVDQYTEKPEVQEIAKSLCDSIRTELATLEGAFSSIYPDQEPLVAAEEPADAEMVKSWVASNVKHQFQLAGLAVRADRAAKNPAKAKSELVRLGNDLRLLNSQARSWKPTKSEAYASKEEFEALAKAFDTLVETVKNQPARV